MNLSRAWTLLLTALMTVFVAARGNSLTAGEDDGCSGPQLAANRLYIESSSVFIDDRNTRVPVYLDNDAKVFGFQISVTSADPNLTFRGVETAGTVSEDADFSFAVTSDGDTKIAWGVVLERDDGMDFPTRVIGPGTRHRLGYLLVSVTGAAMDTVMIRFEDRPGTPSYSNQLVGDGAVPISAASGALATCEGDVTAVPQSQFVRGDANADGSVNVADAVFIFNWLFLGGDRPTCLDAADTDDVAGGGSDHNLTDGQYLLLWLFQGGPRPPSPGPVSCGTDPSPDDSLCLSHAACP